MNDPISLTKQGNEYLGNYQLEKALNYFDQVAKNYPDFEDIQQVHSRRIRIAERLNNLNKALSLVNELKDNTSLEIQKTRALVLYRLKKYDDVISLCNNILSQDDIDNESKAELNFILADAHNKKTNQESKAFDHYKQANYLVKHLPKNAHHNKQYSLQFIDIMEENFKNINKNTSNCTDQPIFLVGFPRSGTTLLRTILDSHKDISVIDEQPTLPISHRYVVDNKKQSIDQLLNMDKKQLGNQCIDYWQKVSQHTNNKHIVDKLPLRFIDIGIVNKLFPKAKYIFLVRHPLDCTLSCFMQNFELNDSMANYFTLDESIYFYDKCMSLWEQYQSLNLDIHCIYYENIINNFKYEINNLLNYLNINWDDNVLNYYKQKIEINTPSYRQVNQKLYNTSINRYKRYNIDENILSYWIKWFNYDNL